jgi:hypothetical protein
MYSVGRCGFGDTTLKMLAVPQADAGVGALNEIRGVVGVELHVVTALNGGLVLRNVNVLVWFGL